MPEDGPLSTPTSAAPITGPGPGPADAITAARALTPVLAARAERHDRDGSFPVEDFADIRTAGLLGVMVPARLGGVGAGHADAYLVAARSLDGGRVSQFLVPAGAGVIVEPTWDSLGMRATGSHDLHIDVLAPADSLLGGVEGLALLLAQVMPQWLVASYAAVYVGVAQAAIDAATAYVEQRGLGRLPAVRARIGRADARVGAARLVVLEAARRVDAAPGEPETNRWVWRAKLLAGEIAMEVAASLLEAAGTAWAMPV